MKNKSLLIVSLLIVSGNLLAGDKDGNKKLSHVQKALIAKQAESNKKHAIKGNKGAGPRVTGPQLNTHYDHLKEGRLSNYTGKANGKKKKNK